ncbi:MAG: hypothetical protein ACUVT5_05750 [Candidatus Bathyarchaeales archaeon]
MRRSVGVALVAVFGALHTVLSMFPGPVGFRSWIIIIIPLEGIILGPFLGFSAGFIGYFLGWFIRPRPEPMFFGLGEPVGALGAGLIAQRKWPHALLLYGMMLLGFFVYPLTASLPLWALWDIYIAFICILIFAFLCRRIKMAVTSTHNLPTLLGFAAFIGTEADVLARIFMLVPLNGYQWWGVPAYVLPDVFVLGAFQTPFEAVISVIATIIIGVPLVKTLQKNKMLNSTTATP